MDPRQNRLKEGSCRSRSRTDSPSTHLSVFEGAAPSLPVDREPESVVHRLAASTWVPNARPDPKRDSISDASCPGSKNPARCSSLRSAISCQPEANAVELFGSDTKARDTDPTLPEQVGDRVSQTRQIVRVDARATRSRQIEAIEPAVLLKRHDRFDRRTGHIRSIVAMLVEAEIKSTLEACASREPTSGCR